MFIDTFKNLQNNQGDNCWRKYVNEENVCIPQYIFLDGFKKVNKAGYWPEDSTYNEHDLKCQSTMSENRFNYLFKIFN
jgi:hypothetical protein